MASRDHTLDDCLHELEAKHYLSDAEQFEEINLKKRKLYIKDQMEVMIRQHRAGAVNRPRPVSIGSTLLEGTRVLVPYVPFSLQVPQAPSPKSRKYHQ